MYRSTPSYWALIAAADLRAGRGSQRPELRVSAEWVEQRPTSGPAEDRNNPIAGWSHTVTRAAAADLRAGRGSQPRVAGQNEAVLPGSGRPPGRPRIATRPASRSSMPSTGQRPTS